MELVGALFVYIWLIMVGVQSYGLNEELVNHVFAILIFLILAPLFEGSLAKKLFIYLSGWMFSIVFFTFSTVFSMLLSPQDVVRQHEICVLVYLFLLVGFFIVLRTFLQDTLERLFSALEDNLPPLLLIYPAIILIVFLIGLRPSNYMVKADSNATFYLLFMMTTAVVYVLLLKNLVDISERHHAEDELHFAKQLVTEQRQHYTQLLESIDNMRVLRHDFTLHVQAVLGMQDKTEVDRYLGQLVKRYDVSVITMCENQAINEIMNRIRVLCEKRGITLRVDLDIRQTIPIDDLTLCVVIGNMMQNAMEACDRIYDNRFIDITARFTVDRLMLLMENSFDGVVSKKGERLLSRKKDGGLGLVSLRRILTHDGDDLSMHYTDTVFTTMVTIMARE
ncbi:hypothetical protein SDC9_134739 [bioreactor metagenome]|uniref:Sensor histidine kinase NatK-like C-terminal domain-containing protein n=1 Tax=bioreactor metagenome TaxID=1076179 RepID=A0A645DEF2_9ZZZZ